jgi:hypothetical protein
VLISAVTHQSRACGAAGRSSTFVKLAQRLDPRDPRPVKSIVNRRSP